MLSYYLKLSWLSLRKTPIISLLMVLAIAIGIGVAITTLTVFYMMSANPMSHKADRIYTIQFQTKGVTNSDTVPEQVTYQDAMAMYRSDLPKYHTPMFKTGYSIQSPNKDIKPFFTEARVTGRDFFFMFDMTFIHGGAWDESIDEIGTTVTVISESLNQRVFGGINSVGKNILYDDEPYTVVGVVKDFNPSPKFYDLNNGNFDTGEQIFVPLSLAPIHELASWGNNNGWGGEKIETYQQKLQSEMMWIQYWAEFESATQAALFKDMMNAYVLEQKQLGRFTRDDAAGYIHTVDSWLKEREVVANDYSVLVGLSFMFLVVCLVNTIGLLLAKFLRRSSEVGVRRALGASQLEVFKQHLVEISLLGSFGGALGLLFTVFGLAGVRSMYTSYERLAQMDLTMIVTAFVLAIVSSVLAGIYPAYRICKTSPAVHLKTQ